jgi:hypothetical protein
VISRTSSSSRSLGFNLTSAADSRTVRAKLSATLQRRIHNKKRRNTQPDYELLQPNGNRQCVKKLFCRPSLNAIALTDTASLVADGRQLGLRERANCVTHLRFDLPRGTNPF